MLELIKQAKIGTIVPVYKEINEEIDALEYFGKVSDYGNKKNSMLFENNGTTFGSANPCLMVTGKGDDFEITALSNSGKKFLNFIKKDFKFCDKAVYKKDKITGKLTPARTSVPEQQKLRQKNHMDIIRAIAFAFKPTTKPFLPYCGLFGMVSYDFANQIEDLPENKEDIINDPDYVFYFLDNMFIANHKTKKTYFVANALITDNNREKTYQECNKTINNYEKLISSKLPKVKTYKKRELKLSYDLNKDEFLESMNSLRRNILDGDILYASPSRLATSNYNAEPLDIYAQLKNIKDGHMFYVNDGNGAIIGSGVKAILNVEGKDEKTVELRIATSAEPRGINKEGIEKDLDNKYEALLKVNESEIAYNIMLADAVRDDVAKISETGTRHVDKLFAVNKHPAGQNITLSVKGILNKDLDALHAYISTINPAVVSGITKVKSMQLLRKIEKTKRCFSSGSMVYVTPEKELHSMTVEPLRIKKDKAFVRTTARVFHNSNDEQEFSVADEKTLKLLDAIKSAGGLK